MQIHVVQPGETLTDIAASYHSAVEPIILVNRKSDPDVLVVGEALVIPDPVNEYVVRDGDQLSAIAAAYDVRVEELASVNDITDARLLYVGELLKIPPNSRPFIEVNAYTTEINESGRMEVALLGNQFTYLSPFMHSMREDGSVTSLKDAPLLAASFRNQVNPLFVLTNFRNGTFDSDLAAAILRNEDMQRTLITNILVKMRAKDYTGLNIDFEYVYPADKENYNAFLQRVVQSLHPEGFFVSTALAPKESATQAGLLYEAHDYTAHGEIADFVIPMTYEWGWAGGRPLAIAPINKVRDVLDYAVTAINPRKILMGTPLYGRDWRIPWEEGTIASTISPMEAVETAAQYGVRIQYDDIYQSPFFRYTNEDGQGHEVWFEDARSMQAKYDTVKEYQLRGISYWVLGIPFPQNWPVLKDNFQVRKIR